MSTGAAFEDLFELGEELGRGGMGAVFAARRRTDGLEVAAKVPADRLAVGLEARILREARLLAEVDHPCLAKLHGCWRDREGALVLIYERIRGRPLDALEHDPRVGWARVPGWILDAGRGLDALHSAGLVHRDLKPGNLMLRDDGGVVLLDFGLARPEVPGETLTQTGMLIGTPDYMAPEQMRSGECTKSVDLYALGCVACAMLTGQPPFPGSAAEVARGHLKGEPPRVSERNPALPRPLDAVVRRALAKAPEERYGSGEALGRALEEAARGRGSAAEATAFVPSRSAAGALVPEATTQELGADGGRRGEVRPRRAGLAALGGLLAVGALVLALGGGGLEVEAASPPGPRPPPRWHGAVDEVRRIRSRLEDDPIVRGALGITDAMDPEEVDARWRSARQVHRARVRGARGAVEVLAGTHTGALAGYDDLAWLARLEGFLTRVGPSRGEVPPPLLAPGEEPGWTRALSRVVRMARVDGMAGTMTWPREEWVERSRDALPGGEGAWTRLLDTLEARGTGEGLVWRDGSIIPRNPLGEPFVDPGGRIPNEAGLLATSSILGKRRDYSGTPSAVQVEVAAAPGDLHLVIQGADFREKFQLWIELGEGEGARVVALYPPPSPGEWAGAEKRVQPRVAVAVEVAEELLPPRPFRARLSVRGLQPIGEQGWVVQVEEVHQRTAPEPPADLMRLLDSSSIPVL